MMSISSPRQLAQDFMVAIAMCADENGLSTTDTVDKFESELEDALYTGLEAARTRADDNDPEID